MPQLRGGLGRGLSALIPAGEAESGLLEVAPGQIRPNPQQPRQYFDEGALRELADSIVEHGLLQPLIVAALPASASGAGTRPSWRSCRVCRSS